MKKDYKDIYDLSKMSSDNILNRFFSGKSIVDSSLEKFISIPKIFIRPKRSGDKGCNENDIINHRNEKFKNENSPYEIKWATRSNRLKELPSYFREFPIFLDKEEIREKWINCLKYYNVPNSNKYWIDLAIEKGWDKNSDHNPYNKYYILIDFLYVKSSIAVEINSYGFHIKSVDKARTKFLKEVFGITTLNVMYDNISNSKVIEFFEKNKGQEFKPNFSFQKKKFIWYSKDNQYSETLFKIFNKASYIKRSLFNNKTFVISKKILKACNAPDDFVEFMKLYLGVDVLIS